MKNNLNFKNNKLIYLLLMLGIFLFSSNFFDKATYMALLIIIVFTLWMLITNRNIYIRNEFIILIICFTSYFLIYYYHNSTNLQNIIFLWLGPIAFYFIGYHICGDILGVKFKKIIIYIVLGTFIHGALNMAMFFLKNIKGRYIPDIWSGVYMTATLQGVLFTMICSLLFYSMFIEKNMKLKVLFVLCILFAIYSTFQTASRTLIIIIINVFVINILLYLLINTKINKKRVIKLITYIILIIISFIFIMKFNIFNIKTIYEESALYERIEYEQQTKLDEDPRFDMYKIVIKNMFVYPMGGNKIEGNLKYAHNIWLDTIIEVGIIPFVLLIIYTIMTIITTVKFIANKYIDEEYKYIYLSIYMSLLLNFSVEPILQGIPYIFMIMCIINGMSKRILDEKNFNKSNIY